MSSQDLTHRRYVLIHGAGQGAWTWDEVARHLRDAGETVTVVNLPGHGDDRTRPADVTLASYVAAVSAAVHDGGPLPVHLVGHSMGGLVITQFAELEPSTVHDLIYVAGLLPKNGQSARDLSDPASSVVGAHFIVDQTNLTVMLRPEFIGPGFCADCDASQLAMLQSRWGPEPLGPLRTPVTLTAANFGSVTKKYLYTVNDRGLTYAYQQAMASTVTLAKSATIDSSHQPQSSKPKQLADVLRELAK